MAFWIVVTDNTISVDNSSVQCYMGAKIKNLYPHHHNLLTLCVAREKFGSKGGEEEEE